MESREMRVREVRDQLGKRIDAAHYGGEATVITSNGERRAAIVPYAWYERMAGQASSSGQDNAGLISDDLARLLSGE